METVTDKKILLTSMCQPLGPAHGDGRSVGYELLHGQVTRAQGLFSPRALHIHFSLEYIAENIDTPAVVLQYPTKKKLIEELKKGYDYVGISFILAVFHRLKEVVALIREHAPHTKIILGGYGTVLSDEVLAPYADTICREEGVGFMRRLLGEPEIPRPYKHPLILSHLKVFSQQVSRTGMIFAGLGCPNGCDFCCTSHFFKRKHIQLLPTGKDIYDVISRYQEIEPGMSMVVLDEDFLLNRHRALELRDCILKGGKPVSMFVFASIRAISLYTTKEILEMGIDGVWIGYEGTRSGYDKQKGRTAEEIFREFRQHGITILASMIIGFPYQTPEIVDEELQGLLALKPVLSQFLIYGSAPGTPFYERIMKEGLLHQDLTDDREKYYKSCTGFKAMVKHPAMTPTEIESIQGKCFQEDYQQLGPSIFRVLDTLFQGYKTLCDSNRPLLKLKAEWYAKEVRKGYPIFLAGKWLGPNRTIRASLAKLEKEMHAILGNPTFKERMLSIAAVGAAIWTGIKLKFNIFQHPSPQRHVFRMPGEVPQPHPLWQRLTELGLPLSVELKSKNTVVVRMEKIFNEMEAKILGASIKLALQRKKDQLVLDLVELVHLDVNAAKQLALSLQEFRGKFRLVIPSTFTHSETAAWLTPFSPLTEPLPTTG